MVFKLLLPILFFSSVCYPDPSPLVTTASRKSIIKNLEKVHITSITHYTNILDVISGKKMSLNDIIKEIDIWEEAFYQAWSNDPLKELYRKLLKIKVLKEVVRPNKEIYNNLEKYNKFLEMLIVLKIKDRNK